MNLNIFFNLKGNNIKCENEVKLLGVTFDIMLSFKTQLSAKKLRDKMKE